MEILSLKHINTFANFFELSDSLVQRVGWELLRLEGAICGIYGRAFALVSCRKGLHSNSKFSKFSISAARRRLGMGGSLPRRTNRRVSFRARENTDKLL